METTAILEKDAGSANDDVKSFAICMNCNNSQPPDATSCDTCGLPISLVRECPRCNQLVSAKHSLCPYCAFQFESRDVDSAITAVYPAATSKSQLLIRRTKISAVCALVFLVVTVTASRFKGTGNVPYSGSSPGLVGTTYALVDATLYPDQRLSGTAKGIIPKNSALNIIGFQYSDPNQDWIEVRYDGVRGYVHALDIAPPTVSDVKQGDVLLRGYLSRMSNSTMASLAVASIDHYRSISKSAQSADELDWILAERLRMLEPTVDSRLVEEIEYSKLSGKPGQYQAQARNRLEEIRKH